MNPAKRLLCGILSPAGMACRGLADRTPPFQVSGIWIYQDPGRIGDVESGLSNQPFLNSGETLLDSQEDGLDVLWFHARLGSVDSGSVLAGSANLVANVLNFRCDLLRMSDLRTYQVRQGQEESVDLGRVTRIGMRLL